MTFPECCWVWTCIASEYWMTSTIVHLRSEKNNNVIPERLPFQARWVLQEEIVPESSSIASIFPSRATQVPILDAS